MLTKAQAIAIASEWYSVNTWADPGVCLYAFSSTGRVQSEEHRAQVLAYLTGLLADDCKRQDNPARERRRLRMLRSYVRRVMVKPGRDPKSYHAEPWIRLMVTGYIRAMLFATNDESDESGGDPLDDNYTADDLAPAALAGIVRDCERFNGEQSHRMAALDLDPERCGMCLFYDQAGHGVGFRDEEGDRDELRALADAAQRMGDPAAYVGDSDAIHTAHGWRRADKVPQPV